LKLPLRLGLLNQKTEQSASQASTQPIEVECDPTVPRTLVRYSRRPLRGDGAPGVLRPEGAGDWWIAALRTDPRAFIAFVWNGVTLHRH